MQQTKVGQKLSVIDLGTNTFHILIAEQIGPNSFNEIFRQRIFVKLGENGIDTIGKPAFQRGLDAILAFKKILSDYQVDHITAFGTAALRTASNGRLFVEKVKECSGISIQLIDGNQEAEYIYLGVIQVIQFTSEPKLIMDIGGGSVEFIIANKNGIIWAQSFPIGLSVLYHQFHHSDPIAHHEIEQLYQFLDKSLQPLFDQLKKHPISQLVGAAGTFDVIDQSQKIQAQYPPHTPIPTYKLKPTFERIRISTLQERLQMEDLPKSRADMIVVGFLLMDYIIQKVEITELVVSTYALKEGVMYEMGKNEKFKTAK